MSTARRTDERRRYNTKPRDLPDSINDLCRFGELSIGDICRTLKVAIGFVEPVVAEMVSAGELEIQEHKQANGRFRLAYKAVIYKRTPA